VKTLKEVIFHSYDSAEILAFAGYTALFKLIHELLVILVCE
jgi:hypothetical protein